MEITQGAVTHIDITKDTSMRPVLQITELKKLNLPTANPNSPPRFRLAVSDGEKYMPAMLATQLNNLVFDLFIHLNSLIRLNDYICNEVQNMRVIIILNLDVVSAPPNRIGNPVAVDARNPEPAHDSRDIEGPDVRGQHIARDTVGTGLHRAVAAQSKRLAPQTSSSARKLARFDELPLPSGEVRAEYVWIDGFSKLHSKGRTVPAHVTDPSNLPDESCDGSRTGQTVGGDSEVIIKPRAIFRDPFRVGDNILVMCDTYTSRGVPLQTNTRVGCAKVMEKAATEEPRFSFKQECLLIDKVTDRPLGFPADGELAPQGAHYCGVGHSNVFGRDVAEAAWLAQLYAGLKVGGMNAEVAPGQWKFKVGPCMGVNGGDQLWMARYILGRVAEIAGVGVDYEAKPVRGDWNGSRCHTSFSTLGMRQEGGYGKEIVSALERLREKHAEHIAAYTDGNDQRLMDKRDNTEFRWGITDRGASCRVASAVVRDGKGCFEDCRPPGNCDPYIVTKMLVATCCEMTEDNCNCH